MSGLYVVQEVYATLGDLIIFPLMDLLGIDDKSGVKNTNRNWEGVRNFFREKIPELDKLRASPANTGKEKLVVAVLEEALDTLNRQLSQMTYFTASPNDTSTESTIDEVKLQHAPLTNLGCESEFAKLDNKIRVSGGSTSVPTYSRKNVISTNGLLVDSEFVNMPEEERLKRWKWARKSDEVIRVKKLEKDFIETVKVACRLALLKKEQMKKKKLEKTLKLLDICKEHSGPMSPATIYLLNNLNEKKLLAEIGYLRVTIAPDIRQRRRVKAETGRYKMERFTDDELRTSIKNAINPEANVNKDVDSLLRGVF